MTTENNVFVEAADALQAVRKMVLDADAVRNDLQGAHEEVDALLAQGENSLERSSELLRQGTASFDAMRSDVVTLRSEVTETTKALGILKKDLVGEFEIRLGAINKRIVKLDKGLSEIGDDIEESIDRAESRILLRGNIAISILAIIASLIIFQVFTAS
jgi:hypothetical protein